MFPLDLKRRTLVVVLATGVFLSPSLPVRADFTLSGNVPQLEPGTNLQLLRRDLDAQERSVEGEFPVRSDHTFEKVFEGEPGLFDLEIPGRGTVPLAPAAGEHVVIQVNPGFANGFTVSGSPGTDDLLAYEAFRKDSLARLVYPPRAALNEAAGAGASSEELARLAQAEVDGYAAHRRELNDFTIERVGASMALYATSMRWDGDYRLNELERLVAEFAGKHPDLAVTSSMQERLRLFRQTAVGAGAPALAGANLEGESVSLDDFKGKVVLIDFWASWCGPCRVENRHHPKVLERFSDEGFEILGVNLDEDRAAWAMASRQDGVNWPQVSDQLGFESPMAKAYNVSALPTTFLVDREGRILAKNLRGEALARKLEELFGE